MTEAFPIEVFLEQFPPPIRETALRLRALIFATVPDTTEGVRSGWRWIGYSLPDRRRVRTFAWIGPERKHIHLGFEHGVLMPDPDRLLHGTEERLKKFRYFTFEREIDLDEAVLADFIRTAAQLAVLSAAERRAMAEAGLELVELG